MIKLFVCLELRVDSETLGGKRLFAQTTIFISFFHWAIIQSIVDLYNNIVGKILKSFTHLFVAYFMNFLSSQSCQEMTFFTLIA